MSLEFDITRVPPAQVDILRVREQAAQDRAVIQKKNLRFTVIAVVVGLSLLSFQLFVVVPAVRKPESTPEIVAIVAYFTPYVIFLFFVTALALHRKLIEKPRKVLDTTLDELKEVTPEELAENTAGETLHGEISAYLEQVTAQGRTLVQAEIAAIQRWLEARRSQGVVE